MNEQWIHALAGGALIGLSATVLLLFNGRIAGISGIMAGVFANDRTERPWRLAFVGGLLLGGLMIAAQHPEFITPSASASPLLMALAGLLVGYGTRSAGGCTSGHGVCGLARGSTRSLAATLTFMGTGGITVYVARHLLGVI